MKVGDLVKYKHYPDSGFGIVLRNTDGLLDLYWFFTDSVSLLTQQNTSTLIVVAIRGGELDRAREWTPRFFLCFHC